MKFASSGPLKSFIGNPYASIYFLGMSTTEVLLLLTHAEIAKFCKNQKKMENRQPAGAVKKRPSARFVMLDEYSKPL